uniref:alginate O-acetyltransferase AlgX-related protein n=2 Tax=Anaerovibrio slackiae TaxID=2652309 RepID=UPI0038652195
QDGYLTYSHRKLDMAEHIGAVAEFAQLVSQQGGRLLYVQSPGKTNPFGDRELDGLDYANYNTDMLLQGLQARGVDVFDLRQDMYRDMGNEGWHKAFFRTDHHWLPSTALWAAEKLAARLHADYDVDVDFGHFSEADYDVVNYENYFLGSQGKKVTLAKTTAEDIALYYPKFSTDVRLEIPSLGIDTRGDFTIMYDMERVKKRDFYGGNPYAAYGYGDMPEIKVHNFTNEHLRDKKILIIRDSMVDTVLPFLSMGLKDITLLDIRHFNGSVRRYVEDCKPDIVIVMYKPSYVPIVWNHKDKFDFR